MLVQHSTIVQVKGYDLQSECDRSLTDTLK
ncbi:hypothetical protein NIES25_34650 [Nostoc linckia NIES-25]|nr:hypothetical protein NIES25_34650 [Nostoc linckia NIES-25]